MSTPAPLAAYLADLEDVPASLVDEALLDTFGRWTSDRGITLYPHQEEAALELVADNHVVLATPTGSGKSMVAIAAHFVAMARGRKSFYTAPIKALVSEKFFALCEVFGAENVGMMTGDASVNTGAPIICATAEIVANIALREGGAADIGQVVMDEFHYFSEPDRGRAWQVPLLTLPECQFLLMSATLGELSWLVEGIEAKTSRNVAVIADAERPVPLSFDYVLTPVGDTVELLLREGDAPIYIVHFTQLAAIEQAQALTAKNLVSKEAKAEIAAELKGFRFSTSFGKTLSSLLRNGVGVHHAGMLPKYRRLVEKLAQDGLLPVICGTDTLGVGINVPIHTVLFTALAKFDGQRQRVLKSREFHQIAGRAGRAGFDTEGLVVVQAPEHEIENAKAAAKAQNNPKKKNKQPKKKPPEGTVSWTRSTFDKLVSAPPESLTSRFRIDNSMLLTIISGPGSCFDRTRALILDSFETRAAKRKLALRAIALFRGLEADGLVRRLDAPDEDGRHVVLGERLQEDFALNQPLAPFAVAAMDIPDPESETYAVDIISIIEAVLEDPRPLLIGQQKKARGDAIADLKADGVEYTERMAIVDEIGWPKPLEAEIEAAFASYAESHAWTGGSFVSPKSVVRDMVEKGMTFSDLVATYGVARAEGVVLRYLTDAYRTMRQTIPTAKRTEELEDIINWLGELVRQVDSSLLDEWEKLTDPEAADAPLDVEKAFGEDTTRPVTGNARAFTRMVRGAVFRHVELLSRDEIERLSALDAEVEESPDWDREIDPYWDEYDRIETGPDARGPQHFSLTTSGDGVEPGTWHVRQTLVDPEGDLGWAIEAVVDLAASDADGDVRFSSIRLVAG